jgi:hypothetical protein
MNAHTICEKKKKKKKQEQNFSLAPERSKGANKDFILVSHNFLYHGSITIQNVKDMKIGLFFHR